jgi:hypothetical protein
MGQSTQSSVYLYIALYTSSCIAIATNLARPAHHTAVHFDFRCSSSPPRGLAKYTHISEPLRRFLSLTITISLTDCLLIYGGAGAFNQN